MKTWENARERKMEWLIFLIFALSFIFVSVNHEPWLDECQAWQIGRCASIKEILFIIPHYEAHPPLWHLILAIPAKLGISFEFGIKLVAGLITLTSGWILLFCSPFPRFIRILLPFHYFLFYQYGIVSRPYGLMGLVFFLLAMQFPKKNYKPWLFVLLLALECMLSAYGIVLAGGISVAWILEICQEKRWKIKHVGFWKDVRFLALIILFMLALFLISDISPKEDTVIEFAKIGQNLVSCFAYTMFMALADSTLLNVLTGEGILRYTQLTTGDYLFGCFIGMLILLVLVLFSSRKKICYLLIPYTFWAIFSAYVYFACHHMGIILLYTISWLWITWNDEDRCWLWKRLKKRISLTERDTMMARKLGLFLGSLLLIVPTIWTAFAAGYDVIYPYYFARGTAEFLKKNHLEDYDILCDWSGSGQDAGDENAFDNMNINVMKKAVALAPYFKDNPFYNFNNGMSDQAFITFRVPSVQVTKEVIKTWKEYGAPDVIIGSVNLNLVYDEQQLLSEYAVAYKIRPLKFSIWKLLHDSNSLMVEYVYIRRELLQQLGLEELTESPFD